MLCSLDSVPSGCSGTASSPFYDFCYDPNYDGSAYFVAGPTAMSFANARAYCSNLGMPLASIHSDSEQALANAACLDVTPDFCWLGGHSIGNAVHDYEWVDGTAWDYTYWAPGEPNQADGSAEDCVHCTLPGHRARGMTISAPICFIRCAGAAAKRRWACLRSWDGGRLLSPWGIARETVTRTTTVRRA